MTTATTSPPEHPIRLRAQRLQSAIRWKALIVEMLAIVFAILLAFGVDAWWSGYQDRNRERAYVTRLIDEFEANRAELERELGIRRQLIAGHERLLRATAPGGPTLGRDSAGALVYALPRFRWYTPATAVYDDLIASGGLNLLRSDSLRTAILRYVQERDRLAIVEEGEQGFSRLQLVPYLVAHGEWLPWLSQEQYARIEIERPAPRSDPSTFLTDPVFANLVFQRWQRAVFVQEYSENVLRAANDVLRLLREETGR